MVTGFKVGDHVRIRASNISGTINFIDQTEDLLPIRVETGSGRQLWHNADALELVSRRGESAVPETVSHPEYYGGADNPYEVIKAAEAWNLDEDGYLFNVLKYIVRAGKKNKSTRLEDLKKARFYIDRRINRIEDENQ